jgi:DNA polymerase (family 10)
MDLPWFPPEIREARQEFAWAEAGKLPELIEVTDLVGDLHMHTTASDGKASLRDMAVAAIQRGLKYIAITDHSPRVSMANGLNPERLREQWAEIDRLNREFDDFTILKGIECDILEKGGMDLPDDVLAEADWVIASVHYGQQQSREQITDRILGAIENPHVDIIAHPTGRLIGRRDPYAVDLDAVFKAADKHGKLLEINANPARLDLDDIAAAAAKRHGIPLVISSDAHSTSGLDVLRYGTLQARRAGLTAEDVANTRPWSKFKRLLRRR